MSICFNSNSYNYGICKDFNNKQVIQDVTRTEIPLINDCAYFLSSKRVMSEFVEKSTKSWFGKSLNEYDGYINNKSASLYETCHGNFFYSASDLQGVINGKLIRYAETNNEFKGTYGDMEFDLKFDGNFGKFNKFFGYRKISGTINGKEVEFDFQHSPIPKDEAVQDVITTILVTSGYAPNIKNDEFNGIGTSKWKQKEDIQDMLDAAYCWDACMDLKY